MPNRRTVAIVVTAAVLAGATSGVAAATAGLRLPALLVASPGGSSSPTPAENGPPPSRKPATPSPQASKTPSTTPSVTPSATPTTSTRQPKPPRKDPTRKPEPKPTPSETSGPEPEEPTKFESTTFGRPAKPGKPGYLVKVDVPAGWDEVETGTWKRDFVDPTEQLTLRVWGADEFGGNDVGENAQYEYDKRTRLNGFQSLGIDLDLISEADGETGRREIQFRRFSYSWIDDDGRTMYGMEFYPFAESTDPTGAEYHQFPGNLMVGAIGSVPQLAKLEYAMYEAMRSYTEYRVE